MSGELGYSALYGIDVSSQIGTEYISLIKKCPGFRVRILKE